MNNKIYFFFTYTIRSHYKKPVIALYHPVINARIMNALIVIQDIIS